MRYSTPGVYREEVFPVAPVAVRTGVPVFLGYASGQAAVNTPVAMALASDFDAEFGDPLDTGYLPFTVKSFFANGGGQCYAVRLDDSSPPEIALQAGLDAIQALDAIDLVAAPDIMRKRQPGNYPPDPASVAVMQSAVISHCDLLGDRFAILDSLPAGDVTSQRAGLRSPNAALYYPWVQLLNGPSWSGGLIPPCGPVAGIYSRSDAAAGVHKAPANAALAYAVDLGADITGAVQERLNPLGINCIRAFAGRGILVWGARTLSSDPAWRYVNARRIFLTATRWISLNMAGLVYEPNNAGLWTRVTRDLNAYFTSLYRQGALSGDTPAAAFYVKCDGETNPPSVRNQGMLVTEIGIAPALPGEFIVVRIVQSASGVSITS